MKYLPGLILSLLISTSAANGHEFWISADRYQLPAGENIVASLRTGEKLSGGGFGFLPPRFQRFDLVQGDTVVPVTGRIGDRPALNMPAPGNGLWVVVHETRDSKITWTEWEKFADFVTEKKLGNALQEHVERGLPQTGFSERYRRFAKSLIAVGDGQGADRVVGLRTEIVALANPYTDDMSGGLPVQVLFQGAPRIDIQLEIFAKDNTGAVTVSTLQTNAEGQALIPVLPGHEYLIDAVVLLPVPPDPSANGPVWESLWAALTFRMPA